MIATVGLVIAGAAVLAVAAAVLWSRLRYKAAELDATLDELLDSDSDEDEDEDGCWSVAVLDPAVVLVLSPEQIWQRLESLDDATWSGDRVHRRRTPRPCRRGPDPYEFFQVDDGGDR